MRLPGYTGRGRRPHTPSRGIRAARGGVVSREVDELTGPGR